VWAVPASMASFAHCNVYQVLTCLCKSTVAFWFLLFLVVLGGVHCGICKGSHSASSTSHVSSPCPAPLFLRLSSVLRCEWTSG
jgi:hypothetical protein